MFGNVGLGELVVIVAVALLVFGPDRLPGMMRQAGKAFRAFQGESQRAMAELRDAVDTSDLQSEFDRSVVMDQPDQWVGSQPAAPPVSGSRKTATKKKTTANKPAARKATARKSRAKKPVPKKPATRARATKTRAAAAATAASTPAIPAAYPPTEDT